MPTLLTIASEMTAVSEHSPSAFESTSYYNGITEDSDHPILIYHSDHLTTPFPHPVSRFANLIVKTLHGVFDTSLNDVWKTVSPQIRNLIKAHNICKTSIDPTRFFTHGPPGNEAKGSLGPPVIWVGVYPSSTSPETAHNVSQEILAILLKHEVDDVVIEWREAVPQQMTGPPLMRHIGSGNATHHVHCFLTPHLSVPLATEEMEEEDAQGTLMLYFHENKDKHGNPSDRVYGVSNCHVLRKDTEVNYEHKGGTQRDYVRVCGMRRFQRGLNKITKVIADHGVLTNLWAREIIKLQAKEGQDREDARELHWLRSQLDSENKAIADLEALHDEVKTNWSNIKLNRNIGYVQDANTIKVDEGGTGYTTDWAAFLVDEARVKSQFEGNIIDLGSKFSPQELTALFYPVGTGPTMFKFPEGRMLQIESCATMEELAHPTEFDSDGHRCLIIGKYGNSTNLTIGCYAGLVSFVENEAGIESIELGIYNSSAKHAEVFSAKGDSGALVWHTRDSEGHIMGQLHSGQNKGGSMSNHITYCTPGWYLLQQIKKRFKYADFYPTSWSA